MKHRLTPSLKLKFAALLLVTFVFWLGNGWIILAAFAELHGATDTVNRAGSLRWQSQRLESDVLRRARGRDGERAGIAATLAGIEQTIAALEQGRDGRAAEHLALAAADLGALRTTWASLRDETLQVLSSLATGAELDGELDRLHAGSARFLAVADRIASAFTQRAAAIEHTALRRIYCSALASLVLILVALVAIHRQIVRPLVMLAEVAGEFAKGCYSRRSGYRSDEEIGVLAQALDRMADETERHIRQIEADLSEIRLAEGELRKLFKALEQSPSVVVITDTDGRIEYVNPRFTQLTGYTREEAIGQNPRLWRSGVTPPEVHHELWRTILGGEVWQHDLLNRKKNGELFWDRTSISAVLDEGGQISHFVAVKEDITERKKTEEILRLRERAIMASTNGIAISKADKDEDNPIIFVNPAFSRITGYPAAAALGRNPRFLLGDDRAQPEVARLREAVRNGSEVRIVLRNYRQDGSIFWNEVSVAPLLGDDGRPTHFISVFTDVTERANHEAELRHRANHDFLTGLANRKLLGERLHQAITGAGRDDKQVAVVFVDLDHFKYINDSLGHAFGDRLIKSFADRLLRCSRASDTVARLGGDEFILVLADLDGEADVVACLRRILSEASGRYLLDGHEIHATCSVGASVFPRDGSDAETLLRHADAAMYRAKDAGRGRYQFFAEEMTTRIQERHRLETGLREALERQELRLEYQPKVDLVSGRVIGAEALLRWSSHELGGVAPERFIPVAEDTGLILPIGEWVINRVCAQLRAWLDAGVPVVPVAANLSPKQFGQHDLLAQVELALTTHRLDRTGLLALEVTESTMMRDLDTSILTLSQLKAHGVLLSLDDFGTGYSSLAYLKRLPIDCLKIDRAFVRDLTTDADDAAICLAIINLAHTLQRTVIAEGVETEAQMDFLRRHRCDEMQGYYFSRPLPADAFAHLLRARQGTRSPPLLAAAASVA